MWKMVTKVKWGDVMGAKTRNAILSSTKQAVCSIRFVLGVVAIAFAVFFASTDIILGELAKKEPLYPGFHGSIVYSALDSDAVIFFVPILCALPFAAAYVDDIKSKFARYCVCRSSYGAYIAGRIAGCAVSGGLTPVLGVLLAYGLSALGFTPLEEPWVAGAEPAPWLGQILSVCGLLFFAGVFWAVLGMCLSSFMESRYIAYASPFILCYVLIILYERYFDELFVIYPRQWIMPTGAWPLGQWSAGALTAMLTLFAAAGFALRAGRRLREL